MLVLRVATKNPQKLETYRAKRNADRTPEPFSSGRPSSQRFVVQLHAARARHYDFRLELGGVLKSWAVPKGPSPNPKDKRLAVHVEDHPLEYVGFEGLIPQGNYGAGAVIVWDRGRWIPLKDPDEGLANGKLLFELRGYKLRGKWTLVKTKRGEKDWLLIKERDQQVEEAGTECYPPDSILSGRTVEQVGAAEDLGVSIHAALEGFGAKRRKFLASEVRPMLAKAGAAFSDPNWVYELKYDGYRLLAYRNADMVTLYSRAGHDLTATFPEIVDVIRSLPFKEFMLDGEVIVHDAQGLPSFSRLQRRGRLKRRPDVERAAVEYPATFHVFDLLTFDGFDTRPLPLIQRKDILQRLLPTVGPLRLSEHIVEQGEAMFAHVQEMGLEGIVAKRADSRYVSRRSADWIKVNAAKSDDFVVLGYTSSKSSQPDFRALLLGQYRGRERVFVGKVGTGFSQEVRDSLARALLDAPPDSAPAGAPKHRDLNWVKTDIVIQVKFKERTGQGLLRQPAFLRVRNDKASNECTVPGSEPEDAPVELPGAVAESPRPQLTNLEKVFWPEDGLTKGDLLQYYSDISPWLLPYLRDRPVVLTRYPDGIEGKSFFQKDAPVYAPDWMRLESMWSEHAQREIRYFVLDNEDALLYVANMASIPLHVWASRISALERPDWCILDLDPKGAPFEHVAEIARFVHRLCEELGLPNYPKTSGSSGLHILIPLGARCTYEQTRTLAELLARVTVSALPEIATITRVVEAREGRVYVDYLQNGHGRLLAAPFAVRALPGAPVSMPLRWSQVTTRLQLARFNIRTAPKLMAKAGDPMTKVLTGSSDLLEALKRLQTRVPPQ